MGESAKRLGSLLLSLRLSISHLRSLEDSERTRCACLKLLESWFPLYYPEEKELIDQFYALAGELGGSLQQPNVGWKYYPVMKLFGWSTMKKVMMNWRKAKMLAHKKLDRLRFSSASQRDGI